MTETLGTSELAKRRKLQHSLADGVLDVIDTTGRVKPELEDLAKDITRLAIDDVFDALAELGVDISRDEIQKLIEAISDEETEVDSDSATNLIALYASLGAARRYEQTYDSPTKNRDIYVDGGMQMAHQSVGRLMAGMSNDEGLFDKDELARLLQARWLSNSEVIK